MNVLNFATYSIDLELAKRLSKDELFQAFMNDRLNNAAYIWAESQPEITNRRTNYARTMWGG
jgi:hypothetical protein